MMNKACLALIIAMCPATLFAGETMVTRTTQTTRTTTGCDFRVDKCATSVATDPSYFRFKDGTGRGTAAGTCPINGDPAAYKSSFAFVNYAPVSQQLTCEEFVALIRNNLSNCPEVTVAYDCDSGDITVHYLKGDCDDCDWVVNVRNVTADDFVLGRTTDNYSAALGQMELRKFHCANEQDAQTIESACQQICKMNSWTMFK